MREAKCEDWRDSKKSLICPFCNTALEHKYSTYVIFKEVLKFILIVLPWPSLATYLLKINDVGQYKSMIVGAMVMIIALVVAMKVVKKEIIELATENNLKPVEN